LTYMSMRAEINVLLGKELFHLKPLMPSQRVGRTMFISKEINAVVHPEWAPTSKGIRFARMRGTLDAFTEGRRITVADDPYNKHPKATMARTDPVRDQVFDLRCLDPAPGIRVFGRFAEMDTFVAVTWEYRENINGRDFDAAVVRCINGWHKLFPTTPLFSGRNLNEYVSNFYPV